MYKISVHRHLDACLHYGRHSVEFAVKNSCTTTDESTTSSSMADTRSQTDGRTHGRGLHMTPDTHAWTTRFLLLPSDASRVLDIAECAGPLHLESNLSPGPSSSTSLQTAVLMQFQLHFSHLLRQVERYGWTETVLWRRTSVTVSCPTVMQSGDRCCGQRWAYHTEITNQNLGTRRN
jgi:hypothetical protein